MFTGLRLTSRHLVMHPMNDCRVHLVRFGCDPANFCDAGDASVVGAARAVKLNAGLMFHIRQDMESWFCRYHPSTDNNSKSRAIHCDTKKWMVTRMFSFLNIWCSKYVTGIMHIPELLF